jgi:cell division protein FtsB
VKKIRESKMIRKNTGHQYVVTAQKLGRTIAYAIITMTSIYFIFHAIAGTNGLLSYIRINNQLKEKQLELTNTKAELERLHLRTKLLSNESLDMDLLEERCRIVLGYCDPNDTIIKETTIFEGR